MDDLRRAEQPKHSVPIGGVSDVPGEEPYRWRQVDPLTLPMHLRMQDVHHGDLITGVEEPARERTADESRTAGDKHGCRQEQTPPVYLRSKWANRAQCPLIEV